jgi:hypothetical protein
MTSMKTCAGLWLSLRRPCITCTGKKDGAGAQVQAVMSTILFARIHGFPYVHTPFQSIEQAPDGNAAGWAHVWEETANLGQNEWARDDLRFLSERGIGSCMMLRWRPGTLFRLQHCHEYADLHPEKYALIASELRRRYDNGKREFIYRERGDRLHVAVHVRRGDVSAKTAPERYSDNSKLDILVRSLRDLLDQAGVQYQIHIISEGEKSDFGALSELSAQWHLNTHAIEAFDRLVRADILITAKSSFSYAAALLNPGIIVYEPFWHKPLPHWNVIGERGDLMPHIMMQIREAAQKLQARGSSMEQLSVDARVAS